MRAATFVFCVASLFLMVLESNFDDSKPHALRSVSYLCCFSATSHDAFCNHTNARLLFQIRRKWQKFKREQQEQNERALTGDSKELEQLEK